MDSRDHNLAHEFPEHKDKIHRLKLEDAHFRNLYDKYDQVEHAIKRSEQRVDLLSQQDEEKLRVERLHLKEQLYQYLTK